MRETFKIVSVGFKKKKNTKIKFDKNIIAITWHLFERKK